MSQGGYIVGIVMCKIPKNNKIIFVWVGGKNSIQQKVRKEHKTVGINRSY